MDGVTFLITQSQQKKINKRGTTIIVASHHFTDIEQICSRIGVLAKGKLIHVGTLHELTGMLSKGQEIKVEIENITSWDLRGNII